MDATVQISRALESASERTLHHWRDLEHFHYVLMGHTRKVHFSSIRIFVSATLMESLRELWVNADSRVSVDPEMKSMDGYIYSYRRMPVITEEGRAFITQDKYIVAYYGVVDSSAPVAVMSYNPSANPQASLPQSSLDLDLEDELDQMETEALVAKFPHTLATPATESRKFANGPDAYYNAREREQSASPPAAASFYSNPADTEVDGDTWDPSDYGGPDTSSSDSSDD